MQQADRKAKIPEVDDLWLISASFPASDPHHLDILGISTMMAIQSIGWMHIRAAYARGKP
jgi:hypothetical protein